MKTYKLLILTLTITFNLFFSTSYSQSVYIDSFPSSTNPDAYLFEIQNLPILPDPGAFYSYLWWMGDNGFCFVSSPDYAFQEDRIGSEVYVSAMTTGHYSTGGPPPLHLQIQSLNKGTNTPIQNLPASQNLHLQHYRNAVINDTMYLIVTYTVPDNLPPSGIYSGTLTLDNSPHAEVLTSFISASPGFSPNDETFNASNSWTFQSLKANEERSILIPVEIQNNEEEILGFSVSMNIDEQESELEIEGVNYSSITIAMAESHDPNQMIAHSNARLNCDYGGQPINYTVQFQNVGSGSTDFVEVVCYLDKKLDLNSIKNIKAPQLYSGNYQPGSLVGRTTGSTQCNYKIDPIANTITFEFNGLHLLSPTDPNCWNLDLTREDVSFSINVLPNYRFGPAIESSAKIIFDNHAPIITNLTSVACQDPLSEEDGGGFYETETTSIRDKLLISIASLVIAIVLVLGIRRRKSSK